MRTEQTLFQVMQRYTEFPESAAEDGMNIYAAGVFPNKPLVAMEQRETQHRTAYRNFFLMIGISFFIMYAVMFLNVADPDHIYISLNRSYMALLMVSPMALLMLLLMGRMYTHRRTNRIIGIASTSVFILAFIGLRSQAAIGDVQYMRGLIPHHSSAILTSTQAHITDPEVRALADGIIEAQRKEIAEMKTLLKKLDR